MKKTKKPKVDKEVYALLKKIEKVTGGWQTGANCAKTHELINEVLAKLEG